MCEINGLSGLRGGWAGALKDTSNERSGVVCSNTIDRNILPSFCHCPSFLFPGNGCKHEQNSTNAVFHLGKTLRQSSHFSERCKVRKIQKQSKSKQSDFFSTITADNHEGEVSSWLLFSWCSKRPGATTTHCSPEQRLKRSNSAISWKVTLKKLDFWHFRKLRNSYCCYSNEISIHQTSTGLISPSSL